MQMQEQAVGPMRANFWTGSETDGRKRVLWGQNWGRGGGG